jgi:hypothetical protein
MNEMDWKTTSLDPQLERELTAELAFLMVGKSIAGRNRRVRRRR